MANRPQILYIGFFRLPDLNAASQRVLANAKALRLQGYDVILAEVGTDAGHGGAIERLSDYEGFRCYRLPMKESSRLDHPRLAIRQITQLMGSLNELRAVIAYNYPALPLARLTTYCQRRTIKISADVTEWYDATDHPKLMNRLAKWADTSIRMRVLHKRLDSLIVISRYLENYYRNSSAAQVVIRVPPLVDPTDTKWTATPQRRNSDTLRLVYAGSPSANKERLDIIVEAVAEAAQTIPIHLHVVGITINQFQQMYPHVGLPPSDLVTYHGRVSHTEALAHVRQADYSLIIRERSRLTEAGFPTKFVESSTLGTPSIVSPHPDLSEILSSKRNGKIVQHEKLAAELVALHAQDRTPVDASMFDFRNFQSEFARLSNHWSVDHVQT